METMPKQKLIKEILEKVSKYGKSKQSKDLPVIGLLLTLNSGKEVINQYSFQPGFKKILLTRQAKKLDWTSHWSSTQWDILHSDSVDGFCIRIQVTPILYRFSKANFEKKECLSWELVEGWLQKLLSNLVRFSLLRRTNFWIKRRKKSKATEKTAKKLPRKKARPPKIRGSFLEMKKLFKGISRL